MNENILEVKLKPGEEIVITLRNPFAAGAEPRASSAGENAGEDGEPPMTDQLHAIGTEVLKTARTVLDALIGALGETGEGTERTKKRVKVD